MSTTTRCRRLPVRACDARRALADTGTSTELARWLRGTHVFEVRQDRLACEVRHSVRLDARWSTRIWWLVIGRPLYDGLIEDAFDDVARLTGSPVRRSLRLTLYARVLRRVVAARPAAGRQQPRTLVQTGVEPVPLAS